MECFTNKNYKKKKNVGRKNVKPKGIEIGGKRNDRGAKKYKGKVVSGERISEGEENKGNYGNLRHKCYSIFAFVLNHV